MRSNIKAKFDRKLSNLPLILAVIISFSLSILLLGGCTEDPEVKFERLMSKAIEYAAAAQLEEARITLLSTVDLMPSSPQAYFELAKVQARQKNFHAAVANYRTVLNLDSKHSEARAQLVSLMLVAGQLELAASEIDKLVATNPSDTNTLLLKANLERKRGDASKSKKILVQLRDAQPSNVLVLANLADIAFAEGHIAEAGKLYTQAVELDPNNATLKLALAGVLSAQGKLIEARTLIESLVSADKNNVNLRMHHADFLLGIGLSSKAADEYAEVLKMDSRNLKARERLFDYYVSQKKRAQLEDLVKDLELQDKNLGYFQGRLAQVDGKVEKALSHYLIALQEHSNFSPVFRRAGDMELLLGRSTEGVEHLNQSIDINAADIGARLSLARHFLSEGDSNKSLRHLDQVLKRYPLHVGAHILRADIYMLKGEFDKAQTVYKLLVDTFKDNPMGYYKLGILQERKGNIEGAAKMYRAGLALDSNILPTVRRLSRLLISKSGAQHAVNQIIGLRRQSKNSRPEYDLVIATLVLSKEQVSDQNRQDARTLLENAISERPSMIAAYSVLASLDEAKSDLKSAAKRYKALIKQRPNHIPSWMLLAKTLESLKDYSLAEQAYRKVLDLSPSFGAAANNLAWLLVEHLNGDLNESLNLALLAKEQMPEESGISDTLGWVYHKRGQSRVGLTFVEDALELEKKDHQDADINPEILYHLGVIKLSLGDKKGAESALRDALKSEVPRLKFYTHAKVLLAEL